jgi:hypothetical protein
MSSDGEFERDLIGDTSKHDRSTSLWLGSALRAVASSRIALSGAGLVVLAAIASWTAAVLWAAPALFVILFAGKLLDGRTRQSALRRARILPIRLPEPMRFSDGAVREIVQSLAQARQKIGDVLDTGPRGPGFDLGNAIARVPQLERDVVVLAQRAEYAARFLATNQPSDLLAEERRYAERIEREENHDHAKLLCQNREHIQARIKAAAALSQEYERLVAAAKYALGALEGLPSRMTLLQLRRLNACHMPSALEGGERADVDESLQEMERVLASDRLVNVSMFPTPSAHSSSADA